MCLLEAIVLAVLGIVELVSIHRDRLALGVTTTIFLFVYAAGLVLAGIGIGRARSWARAPVVLSQLIQVGLAWSFHGGATTWLAVCLAVPAVAVLIIAVRPATTAALYDVGEG